MLTFLVSVLLLTAAPTAAGPPDSGPDSEEYAIYALILNDLKMIDEDYILINDRTTTDKKPTGSSIRRIFAWLS